MSEQPIPVTEAEAEAQAVAFLADHDVIGAVDLSAEGDSTTVLVPPE